MCILGNHSGVIFNQTSDIVFKTLETSLYVYILPVIVVTGSIGNVAALAIFWKGKFRHLSVGVYMRVYSIINLLNLFLIFGQSWIVDTFSTNSIDNLSGWTCKVWNFFYRVISYSCVWLIVGLTVDRYLYVCHPLDAKRLCTVFLAKIAIAFIFVGLTVVSVHAMWSYLIMGGKCIMDPCQDLHIAIWRWITMSVYCFVPFCALFVLNIRLIIGVYKRKQKLEKAQRNYDFVSATLAISVMYLALNLPGTITNIKEYIDWPSYVSIERVISDFLSCGNPTAFFFLCLIFSKTFRDELVLRLRKKSKVSKPINMNMTGINKYEYIECASETFV